MDRPLWRGALLALWLLSALPATALTPGREPAPALATACPGPDALGYVCQDSGRAFTVGDTDIGNHCDDCTTAVSLPFPFTFYGITYTTANVSSNGNLQFGSNNNSYLNTPLPAPNFTDAVFPYWDDLLTNTPGSGIFTKTERTAPSRIFTIEWRATFAGDSSHSANFEIQIDESTTWVFFVYGASTGLSANGASATSGIQHSMAASNFLQRTYQQAVLNSNNGAVFAQSADLSITQTGPSTAVAGTPVSYTLTVANNGPGDGFANVVGNRPPHTSLVACQQVSGPHFNFSCDSISQQMFGPLQPGESAVLRLTLFINSDTPNGTALTHTASVGWQFDVLVGNNSSSLTTTVAAQADLGVTKSGPAGPLPPGQNVTYTLGVTNSGPSDAASVTLADPLPSGTTFVSEMQTAGPSFTCTNPAVGSAGTVSCNLASLVANTSASFQVVVRINTTGTVGATLANTATVSSAATDPSPGNNTATATTAVLGANLALTNSGSPDPSVQGQNVTYTLTLSNSGPHDAQNVSLADPLPAGTTFVSFTAPAGWATTTPPAGGAGSVTATRSTLANGASAVFTLVVKLDANVGAGTAIANTASVSSSTPDPSAANNTATATTTASQNRVVVGVAPAAAGRLQSTIRARNSGCSPNDQLVSLHFTRTDNATVDVLGTTGRGGDFTVAVPPGTAQVTLTVNRVTAGQPATVQLVVTDGCGAWPTFVGGGAGAF